MLSPQVSLFLRAHFGLNFSILCCELNQFLWEEIQTFLFLGLFLPWAKSLSKVLVLGMEAMMHFPQSNTPAIVAELFVEEMEQQPQVSLACLFWC